MTEPELDHSLIRPMPLRTLTLVRHLRGVNDEKPQRRAPQSYFNDYVVSENRLPSLFVQLQRDVGRDGDTDSNA